MDKFAALALAAASILLSACLLEAEAPAAPVEAKAGAAELTARPGRVTVPGQKGFRQLGRRALLYVPAGYEPGRPMPLVVMLHGAGGNAQHSIDMVRRYADRYGFILLAPRARGPSWDLVYSRRFGSDVSAIDALLRELFASYSIDPARLAMAGFSDGASYALSLGLSNGELFSRLIAFSPCFMAPSRPRGRPQVFISHGVQDRVLPIQRCSREIVPLLKAARYEVEYVEFPGGHTVRDDLADSAFRKFASWARSDV